MNLLQVAKQVNIQENNQSHLTVFSLCFRLDKKRSRYIGAICGLGPCKNSKHSLLPENDIELPFDVTFTEEDMCMVSMCGNLLVSEF